MKPMPRPAAALLTAEQIASRYHVALRTVRRWITASDLRVLRLGRAVRITEDDLERFLQRSRH